MEGGRGGEVGDWVQHEGQRKAVHVPHTCIRGVTYYYCVGGGFTSARPRGAGQDLACPLRNA